MELAGEREQKRRQQKTERQEDEARSGSASECTCSVLLQPCRIREEREPQFELKHSGGESTPFHLFRWRGKLQKTRKIYYNVTDEAICRQIATPRLRWGKDETQLPSEPKGQVCDRPTANLAPRLLAPSRHPQLTSIAASQPQNGPSWRPSLPICNIHLNVSATCVLTLLTTRPAALFVSRISFNKLKLLKQS